MTPRQARRERREAERKAKKLEFKKARQASGAWSSATENRQASAPPLPGVKESPRQASGARSSATENRQASAPPLPGVKKSPRQASGAWSSATENRQASAPPLPGVKKSPRQASGARSSATENPQASAPPLPGVKESPRQASGAWSSATENRQASAPPLPGVKKSPRQASGARSSATENRQASAPPLPGVKESPRQASGACSSATEFPEIQPRWNPALEDEFPREEQIRNNAMADRISLQAGLPIPPPGPTPGPFSSLQEMREHYLAKRNAAARADQYIGPAQPADSAAENGFVSHEFAPLEILRPDADVNEWFESARQSFLHADDPAEPSVPEIGFVSQNGPTSTERAETGRAAINRANAQFSSGPKTPNGKLVSSRNATKHGLASGQLIVPGEDPAEFDSLLAALLEDHQASGETEQLLIKEMAQSHWLAQRAIRLQNGCFTEEGVNEKSLSLFLRYFTTHNRAFHKALADLQRSQKERRKQERGFVSRSAAQTAANIGFVSQTAHNETPDDEFVRQNNPSAGLETGFVSQTACSESIATRQNRTEAA